MSADDDVDTSEAHQVQAIQDIETSGDPRDFRASTEKTNMGPIVRRKVDPAPIVTQKSLFHSTKITDHGKQFVLGKQFICR